MKSNVRLALIGALSVSSITACQSARRTSGSDVMAVEDSCADAHPSNDPIEWLTSITLQSKLTHIFQCSRLPADQNEIPVGHGRGYGSLIAGWLAWNYLQVSVGSTIWGGKQFERGPDGVHLFNYMLDNNTHRYSAHVVVGEKSLVDQKPFIYLDYSADNSVVTFGPANTPAQKIIDPIARGIRDEIREIVDSSGARTGVYIGRANLQNSCVFHDLLHPPKCGRDGDDRYAFAANFFLDFRSAAQ